MDSMEKIYLSHARTVYAFLLTKTHDPDLAEELTQETFYQAVKNIHTFKGDSSMVTWLCAIARNVWYDSIRKQKRQMEMQAMDPGTAAWGDTAASAEAETFRSWENIQVLKQLHRLEEPMREVMYLRLIGNLTFGQIGEIMEKSENWARVTYYRAKERVVKEAEKL